MSQCHDHDHDHTGDALGRELVHLGAGGDHLHGEVVHHLQREHIWSHFFFFSWVLIGQVSFYISSTYFNISFDTFPCLLFCLFVCLLMFFVFLPALSILSCQAPPCCEPWSLLVSHRSWYLTILIICILIFLIVSCCKNHDTWQSSLFVEASYICSWYLAPR